MPSCTFLLVDVFTDTPFAGNQLAVIPDGRGLDSERMQDIAREFNFSETTFVVPPRDPKATRRLRSFSPTAEVFGAGHNALGAWWAVAARGDVQVPDGDTELWQELGERVTAVYVTKEKGQLRHIAMTQSAPRLGSERPSPEVLARALALDVDALTIPELPPQVVSTGATHLLVPARGLADLAKVRVDGAQLTAIAKPLGCEGCYLFCLETLERGSQAHARAFFPGIGIAEDPATGSAAGPLGYYLVSHRRASPRTWLTVEQGDEIHRSSRINVWVDGDRVDVAGRCAIVGEGTLRL